MTSTKKNRSFEHNPNDKTFEQRNEDTEQINNALDPAPKDEEPNIDKPPISVDEKSLN